MRGSVEIRIAYGAAIALSVVLRSSASPHDPIDVTGYTAELRIARYDGTPYGVTLETYAVSVGTTDGLFEVTLTGPETQALASTFGNPVPRQRGMWSLWVTPPAGAAAPIAFGTVRFLPLGHAVDPVDVTAYIEEYAVSVSALDAPGPAGPPGAPGAQGPSGIDTMRDYAGQLISLLGKVLRFDDDVDLVPDEDTGEVYVTRKQNLRNWRYKAVASSQSTTVTTTASSATVTLASNPDFDKRHGVIIFGAGPNPELTKPPAPVATLKTWSGDPVTNGTVTMQFCIIALDGNYAHSVASDVVTVEDCPDYFGVAPVAGSTKRNVAMVIEDNIADMTQVSRFIDERYCTPGVDTSILLVGMTDKTKNGGWSTNSGADDGIMALSSRFTIMDTAAEMPLGMEIRVMKGGTRGHSYWRVFNTIATVGSSDIEIHPEVYCELAIPIVEVHTCSTGPLTLSGLQTVNTVSGAVDRKILVKDQADPAENDVYLMKSGAWQRLGTVGNGTRVRVGVVSTGNAMTEWGSYWVMYEETPNVVGTDPIRFRRERIKHYVLYGRRSTDGGETYGSWVHLDGGLAEPEMTSAPKINYRGVAKPANASMWPGGPLTPPSATGAGCLRTRIRSLSGLTAVLEDAPSQSVSGAIMRHDNSLAFKQRAADCSPVGSAIGGTIELPGSVSVYEVWEDVELNKQLWLRGDGPVSTQITMGAGCGIVTQTAAVSSEASSAARCRIDGVVVRGWESQLLPAGGLFVAEGGREQGALIFCRTTTTISYARASGCYGTCIAIKGDSVNKTNANRSRIDDVTVASNYRGHGLYCGGDNANVHLELQLDAQSIDGHAQWETTQLGGCSVSRHASGTSGYPCYSNGGPFVDVAPYSEQGQGPIIGSGAMVVLGGTGFSGIDDTEGDLYLSTEYCSPMRVRTGAPDSPNQYHMLIGSRATDDFEVIKPRFNCAKPMAYERTHDGAGGIRENYATTNYNTCVTAGNDPKGTGLPNFPRGFTFGTGTRKRRFGAFASSGTAPLGYWQPGDILVDDDGEIYTPSQVFGIGSAWSNRTCVLGDIVYPTSTWDAANPGHNNRAWRVTSFTGGDTVQSATIGPTEPTWNDASTGVTVTAGGCVLTSLPANSRTTSVTKISV